MYLIIYYYIELSKLDISNYIKQKKLDKFVDLNIYYILISRIYTNLNRFKPIYDTLNLLSRINQILIKSFRITEK